MAEAKKAQASYGNESISALKGADRVLSLIHISEPTRP